MVNFYLSVKWLLNVTVHQYGIFRHELKLLRNMHEQLFGKYQASEMLSQEWHAWNRLGEAVTNVDGIESQHSAMCEASLKQSKKMYAMGSRRKRSAMDEIVAMQNTKRTKASDTCLNLNWSKRGVTGSTREACKKS